MGEKILNQAGLQTLWTQIKAKFTDETKLNEALKNYKTNAELVEILSSYVTAEEFDRVVAELQAGLSSVYTYKGSVESYADLPTEGVKVGDTYNVKTADASNGIAAGDSVAWDGSQWNKLGSTIDLSSYATTEYVNAELNKKAAKEDIPQPLTEEEILAICV